MTANGRHPVTFDLHGFVTVRVVDAGPRDVRAVARQLGPIQSADVDGPADITVRFVDRLDTGSTLKLLGRHEVGFTDDAFVVLRAKQKSRTRVKIPMELVGGPCEIVCEHGTAAVPLLIAIVNLTAVTKGVLPLHASAFDWKGTGVVVTGWSKGGKTETLLAFASRGARYIADEWCYVEPGGQRIFGVPEPVRLWRWQLRQLPAYRRRVPVVDRVNLAALGVLPAVQAAMPRTWQQSGPGRAVQRAAHFAEQRLHVQVAPERLFDQAVAATDGAFDRLVFVVSTEDPDTTATPIAPQAAADRMEHSLDYERQPLMQCYRMFRFAFPGVTNPHLEGIETRQRELLARAFAGKPALMVEHPYPVELTRLFECIEAFAS